MDRFDDDYDDLGVFKGLLSMFVIYLVLYFVWRMVG